MKHEMHDPRREEWPTTAQPVGSTFCVDTRGIEYRQSDNDGESKTSRRCGVTSC